MFFRLQCHFCGARSRFSKGTTEFQCRGCEAWNFFDRKGNVVDTPARVAAAPRSPPATLSANQTFAQPGYAHFTPNEAHQPFCQTCLTNQRIYTESLGNYLPDEDHPQYYEYEQKLPQYKADLERRYPQVCKKCGPKAQSTISKADRYGLQQNVAKNVKDTTARRGRTNRGQRDDWSKWGMRRLFGLLRLMLYGSLLVQMTFHAYAFFIALCEGVPDTQIDPFGLHDEPYFNITLENCARESLNRKFEYACFRYSTVPVSWALLTSFLLLWYHPGMSLWYHHTIRVEFVFGRSQYFFMQAILLFVRTIAWINLSNLSIANYQERPRLLAEHAFLIVFMPFLQRYSERMIRFDAWRIKGRMMRGPEEEDAFGTFAGLEKDKSPPQASSVPPVRLFERDSEPFPIANLAPRATRGSTNQNFGYRPPPSPPDSQSVSDDEMDWQPISKPQMPGETNNAVYRPRNTRQNFGYDSSQTKGWTPMRDELFGIKTEQEVAEQRQREEAEQARLREEQWRNRSPFHGTLPQDPMHRRYHGARVRPEKKEVPTTQRPDYFAQMSKSFGSQRYGPKTPSKIGKLDRTDASTKKKSVSFTNGLGLNDDDEDFSPVKSRKGSSLNLRESQWTAPDRTEATGLEDLFGGNSFRIADHEQLGREEVGEPVIGFWPWKKIFFFGALATAVSVGWNVPTVRRAVCLWLVEKLDGMGY